MWTTYGFVATGGAGLAYGGSRTVIWTGGEAGLNAATQTGGRVLERTIAGWTLRALGKEFPKAVWAVPSALFAASARGTATAVCRGPLGWTFQMERFIMTKLKSVGINYR